MKLNTIWASLFTCIHIYFSQSYWIGSDIKQSNYSWQKCQQIFRLNFNLRKLFTKMKLDKDLFACFSHIILNVNEYRWTAHIFIFLMPIQEIKSKYTHSLICLCVFTIQDISFCLLYKRSSYYQSYISDISLFNA